jgi:hypothetical protein
MSRDKPLCPGTSRDKITLQKTGKISFKTGKGHSETEKGRSKTGKGRYKTGNEVLKQERTFENRKSTIKSLFIELEIYDFDSY